MMCRNWASSWTFIDFEGNYPTISSTKIIAVHKTLCTATPLSASFDELGGPINLPAHSWRQSTISVGAILPDPENPQAGSVQGSSEKHLRISRDHNVVYVWEGRGAVEPSAIAVAQRDVA